MLTTKGGNLNDFSSKSNVSDLKPPADDSRITKQSMNFLRGRVGCDIKIFRLLIEQEIPHTPTHEIGVKALFAKASDHFKCC
jgi:hypothetical protein